MNTTTCGHDGCLSHLVIDPITVTPEGDHYRIALLRFPTVFHLSANELDDLIHAAMEARDVR